LNSVYNVNCERIERNNLSFEALKPISRRAFGVPRESTWLAPPLTAGKYKDLFGDSKQENAKSLHSFRWQLNEEQNIVISI